MKTRIALFSAALLVFILTAGCEETKEVVVPPYEDPPPGAADFLGYSRDSETLTTCGNCHAGQQSRWEGHAHSTAWKTLQDSGNSQEFCENCHATGPLGNSTTEGGYDGTLSARYHDVQCESCHGPGLDHVMNPDDNKVEMKINVDDDPLLTCGECHSGGHHPFVNEWAMSGHGTVVSNTVGRPECAACHNAQGALASFGVDSRYEESGTLPGLPIVCVVCHNPHGSENPAQMRFPLNSVSAENNMCIKCHHRRAEPDESGRGPHSPEGPLILGEEVGWWPPGFVPPTEAIRGTHGTERNTNLCATCHVFRRETVDSSGVAFNSTGHLFAAIPCIDENGAPLPPDMQDCDVLTERSFASCVNAGCHGDEIAARTAYTTATTRIENAVEDLMVLLDQLPDSLFASSAPFTVAKGADFNRQLAERTGSAVHNPFLIELLLDASEEAVMEEYGVSKPKPRGAEE